MIAVLIYGAVAFALLMLWTIVGILGDIKHYLRQVYISDLNFECFDPSDHYKFQIGNDNDDGTWTYRSEEKE